jgi:YidC/Oxa1 family membrane protein insertase
MSDFFYTLIIFPLAQIIELAYVFVNRVTDSSTAALAGVSVAVSVLTLPLYFRAEKWQQLERETQKRLKPRIDKIKAVFKGDEQYMMLSVYYRQNHYHPIYALRSSLGLLIQIPFFIAAYSYLTNLTELRGAHFLFISDLGAPDRLICFGALEVNILPIAMTLINIAAGAIYTKGFPLREKLQLYGMAAVFLVLLYNSPAGLILYWTMNNVFSLVKNILQKTRRGKRWVYFLLFSGIAAMDVYLLFFHSGDLPNRLLAILLFTSVCFLPLAARLSAVAVRKYGAQSITRDKTFSDRCFILSSLLLFALIGIVVPSSLIASSVEEFSFMESGASPFPFIGVTALQSAGIFLFWALSLYLFFIGRIREGFTVFFLIAAVAALINVFLASENFGFLTNTLIFSDVKPFSSDLKRYALNLFLLIVAVALILFLILTGKKMIIMSFQIITLISLVGFGTANIVKIQTRFAILPERQEHTLSNSAEYTFSRTGKNVLVFMLDAAVSGYVPYIFDEKPELLSAFSGFTWYPNCVSFANHTMIGAPPIYGGYEYTPEAISRRDTVPLVQKQKEAYLLLPVLFFNSGYTVTITDPPFDNYQISNLSVFSDYPQIHAVNLQGKYTSQWLNAHPGIKGLNITNLLHNKLIRFSFFKVSPLILRFFLYDDGDWLATDSTGGNTADGGLTSTVINDYAFMDLLPDLTAVRENGDTYTAIYGHLAHSRVFFQTPEYIPVDNINGFDSSHFSKDSRYHANMASFLLFGKYCQFLKDNGIYDNTRIILVADHGRGSGDYPNNIDLPYGRKLQSYNPLLMVKDFYAQNELPDKLSVDHSFMTNADTPFFALRDIVTNPVNPFTHTLLTPDKADGIALTTIGALSSYRHSEYGYTIGADEWLHVHDNIFDANNWEKVKK